MDFLATSSGFCQHLARPFAPARQQQCC